jgi:hypothetical protein
MCTQQLPPGGYPIAVKYIISYPRNTGATDMIIIIRPLGAAVVPHPDTLPRLKSASSYPKLNARIIRKLIYFDVTYYLLLLGTDFGKFIPGSSRNFREDCSSWSQGSRFVITATTKYRTARLSCVSLHCFGLPVSTCSPTAGYLQ